MKLIHRTLLVWLLLLALPFQGLAAAGMLPCAPGLLPAQAVTMQTAMDGGHCAPDPHTGKHGAHDGHHGHHSDKAGSCAACCIGAAMAPAVWPALALAPPHFISIPFRAGHVPSVDPALPERPPRTDFA